MTTHQQNIVLQFVEGKGDHVNSLLDNQLRYNLAHCDDAFTHFHLLLPIHPPIITHTTVYIPLLGITVHKNHAGTGRVLYRHDVTLN